MTDMACHLPKNADIAAPKRDRVDDELEPPGAGRQRMSQSQEDDVDMDALFEDDEELPLDVDMPYQQRLVREAQQLRRHGMYAWGGPYLVKAYKDSSLLGAPRRMDYFGDGRQMKGEKSMSRQEFEEAALSHDTLKLRMDDKERELPDGRIAEDPFSRMTLDYEVRVLDDAGKVVDRGFRYRRKTAQEWSEQGILREQLLRQRYAEYVDQVLKFRDGQLVRTVLAQLHNEINGVGSVDNPFNALIKASGGRQRPRTDWYIEWEPSTPMPKALASQKYEIVVDALTNTEALVNAEGDAEPPLDTPAHARWVEECARIAAYIQKNSSLWHREWMKWVEDENQRSYRNRLQQSKARWNVEYDKQKRILEDDTDRRRAENQIVYPWEDTDVETRMPISLLPSLPVAESDSMIFASYERALCAQLLKEKAIMQLHWYMTQTVTPATVSEHYYCGAYWRSVAVARAMDTNEYSRALFGTATPENLPPHLIDFGQATLLAQQFVRLMSLPEATWPIDATLTFENVHGSLSRDAGYDWSVKRYPTFHKLWQALRGVVFNAMLFNKSPGLDPEVSARESEIYDMAKTLLSGKLDLQPGDSVVEHFKLRVVDKQPTSLDIEMLRLQYEEFDKSVTAVDSDRLADQPNYSVRCAVPCAKHEVFLSHMIEQLAADPFAMPLWSRWLAPRFYKHGGNPVLMNVWHVAKRHSETSSETWQALGATKKMIPTWTPDQLDALQSIQTDVGNTIYNDFVQDGGASANDYNLFLCETRQEFTELWAREAMQYIDAAPVNPDDIAAGTAAPGAPEYQLTDVHYKLAIDAMVRYLVHMRASYFRTVATDTAPVATRYNIHRIQYTHWRRSQDGTDPICLDDILVRHRQGYYTGRADVAISNLERDLKNVIGLAKARYTSQNGWEVENPDMPLDDYGRRMSSRDKRNFFDNQYDVAHLNRLRIHAAKFLDFTKICERYYLTGYESIASNMTRAQHDERISKMVVDAQKEVNRLQQLVSKAADAPRQNAPRASKQASTLDFQSELAVAEENLEQALNAQTIYKSAENFDSLTKKGRTLGRLPTIRKLAAEKWVPTKSAQDLYNDQEPGQLPPLESDVVPSAQYEWRKRQTVTWLSLVLSKAGQDATKLGDTFTDNMIAALQKIAAMGSMGDDLRRLSDKVVFRSVSDKNEIEISPEVFERIGLHQIAAAFESAQRALGLEQVKEVEDLSNEFDWQANFLVDRVTERIKKEGVPPIPGMPRDLQAGMEFVRRDANGMVLDGGRTGKDLWASDDYNPIEFYRLKLKQEEEDPIAEWCNRLTGELKLSDPEFYLRFTPDPRYFSGGEAGSWWQRILELSMRDRITLKESAFRLTTGWLEVGLFAWDRKYEALLDEDGVVPVFVGRNALRVVYEQQGEY